jgi:hypothetical protein
LRRHGSAALMHGSGSPGVARATFLDPRHGFGGIGAHRLVSYFTPATSAITVVRHN